MVDIDHLDSRREAEKLKRQLFDDLLLRPVLAFTSPSGHGVKAFIPYDLARIPDTKQNTSENIHWAMNYVQAIYDSTAATRTGKIKNKPFRQRRGPYRQGLGTGLFPLV